MADYQPLLQRAVEALSDRSPDMRRAVYERARSALLEQLRSLDPPLSDDDIARERRALDEAIGRIETGFGAPPRPAPPDAPPPPAAAPPPAPKPQPLTPPHATPAPQPPKPRLVERAPDPRLDLPEAAPPGLGRPVAFTLPERRRPAPAEEAARAGPPEAEAEPAGRERPRIEAAAPRASGAARLRSVVLGLVLLTVVGAIAVAAWLLREDPAAVAEPPVVEAPRTEEGGTKTAERLGAERAPAQQAPAAPAQAAPAPRPNEVSVAQRAVLYEENPANPQVPRATAGRAIWRLDAVAAGQGQPLETAVRAQVEVPEAGLTLALLLRRNVDATLPASHTIELVFTLGGDGQRVVRDVALLQLKGEEAARGAPMAGLPVPVRDNLFLIGLSSVPTDVERNKDLLLRRNWIDLPIRFASGQRAIVSFEKGVSGDQILAEAFRQWGG